MNFKKMFGIVATFAMMTSMLPVATLGASYSSELEGAYNYAYEAGITTQSSIDSANMYGQLIRSHMAKMMVNYAEDVLGQTADTSVDCPFTDIANQSTELQDYMVRACQMGLMGRNNDGSVANTFNPNGVVTRAQFGTVLSRALYGDIYNGGNPWYADHLTALQADGVMNNISTPNAPEVRGYVMLMMQRADESGVADTAGCNDELTIAACAVGDASCPAACQTPEEVKAGSLNVSLNSSTIADGSEIPSTGTVMFAAVDFRASSNDVTVRTVELKKLGLATVPTSTRVRFEKAGVRVSGKASFTSEGLAMISFAPAFVVKANATETLDLYVELATSANQDFQFTSNSFDSTAVSVNGGFTTPKLRTANYAVAGITMAAASIGSTANVTTNGMEIGAFTLQNTDTSAETRDVKFKSVTLRQNGNASLSNLSDIVIERNGLVVSSNPTISSRDITFTVNDTVKDSTTATYYIKAIVNNVETSSDTYEFQLRNTTDLNAAEVNTSFRSTVTATTVLSLNIYTIEGAELTFARDAAYALSANYAAGSEVVLMKGTITSKSAVTLEDPTVFLSSAGITTGLNAMFSTIYLQVGSSTFSFSPTATDTGAAFLGAATVNGTANVKMYGTLKDTASATAKFNDLKLSSFRLAEYVSNGYTVATAIGNIAGISVTAQTPTLNVTRTDALGNTNMAAGSTNVKVYGLRLSSTQGNGVTISRVVLATTGNTLGTSGYNSNVDLDLYLDGTLVGTKTVTTGNLTAVTFDGFNKKITTTTPLDIEVRGNFTEAFSTGTFKVTLGDLNAYDTLTSTAITGFSKPAGAVFTVNTAVGTLAASNENPVTTLFKSPSLAQKVLAFKVTATNDNVRLYDVTATGVSLDSLSNFKLTDAAGVVLASATTATSTGVTFTSISNAPYVTKDTSASYFIVADVNSTTNTAPIWMSVTTAGTNVKGSNGLTIASAGANVTSRTHAIAENVPTLAMVSNPSKSLTTSALRFTVAAAGTNNVTLTGLAFNNALAGYTGTMVLRVYKTSVASINLAGEAPFAGTTSPTAIAMTGNSSANSVVDAGSTVEYIVVVEGALVDPSATSTDWSISLTNAYFGGFAAASYNSIGALPFTSVK